MKPCFAGLGAIMLAATPLAAIPLALSGTTAQAQADAVETPPPPMQDVDLHTGRPARA